jgi:hypothetical protein
VRNECSYLGTLPINSLWIPTTTTLFTKVQPAEWHCEVIASRVLLDYPCCEFDPTLSLPRHNVQAHVSNEQEYDIRMIHVSDSSPRDDSPS